VTPIDDAAFESNETVVLTLAADPAYRVGSPAQAIVTIVSDDLPPDLVVTAVVVPSASGPDVDIVVTDTTVNQGSGPSTPSMTGFYLSLNTTLDGSDVLLGSRSVTGLGAAASDAHSTTVHLPMSTAPGAYYVLAKADYDAAVAESVETNNVKPSGVIRIGPDLIVSGLVAPASVAAGTAFTVTDTTTNQGGGAADSSTTRFYLSANTLLDAADLVLGNRAVAVLAAAGSSSASTVITLPAGIAAGTYYVIAQADAGSTVRETSETNNSRVSGAVKVGPDLIVTAVAAPSTAAAGAVMTVTDSTKNQGAGPAPTSSTGFYLSANLTVDASDVFLGSRAAGELAAGATATGSTALQIPAGVPPGSYYVVARADWNNAVVETTETNNDRASGGVKLGGDLVVTALSASSTAMVNGTITIVDTTANQGAAALPESATGFSLSLNGTFSPSTDVFMGTRSVPGLQPAGVSSATTQLPVPPGTVPGTYYVIGVADASSAVAESTESNNTRNSGSVRIGPDLVVSAVTGPSSAVAGTSVSVGDTTTNSSGDVAAASATSFYLSSNTAPDGADVLQGTRSVPSLSPVASSTGSVTVVIPASTTAGTWFIIAKADGANAIVEAVENNNTRAKSITVAAAP
jgi:subtilase family serine protease